MNQQEQKREVWFSPRQRKVVAAGVTVLCATLTTVFICTLVWGIFAALAYLSEVLVPLLVAVILAMLFKPYYDWLERRLSFGGRRVFPLAVFYLSLLLPILCICLFFGKLLTAQFVALVQYLPTVVTKIYHAFTEGSPTLTAFIEKYRLNEMMPFLDNPSAALQQWLSSLSIGNMGGKAVALGTRTVRYAVSLAGWLIVPVYLGYLITRPTFGAEEIAEGIKGKVVFLKRETQDDLKRMIVQFLEIVVSYFRGQVLDALIQGVLFGFGFWLVGLPYGLLIGFFLGLLNLVPYLGNMVGLAVALPLAYFGDGGSFLRLALTLSVFLTIQVLDGFWISLKIQGDRTGLSNFEIVFSLLFWGVVFQGILGMLLAVPLTAFLKVFWELLHRKYLNAIKGAV
ncbi:MAG: AI-2E family transporter [Kiritimatiellae bacterium]|nr:AI-2E family transporter [Kiritimatiellia bacterium]